MLRESYEEAKKLLKENRELMDKLAAHLIEKETITGKEFMKIYRQEKGIPEPEETAQSAVEQESAEPVSAEVIGEVNTEAESSATVNSEIENPEISRERSDVGLFSEAEVPSDQNRNE